MINIISNNPYRVLGIYANSPKKDAVASQAKINAFLKVGKEVSFPLDLVGLLPPISRTTDSVTSANSQLTLPKEQLKFAQFWLLRLSTFDDVAFKHLSDGDIEQAIEIWAKKMDVASLQNRIVCGLIKQDYSLALRCAEKLYGQFSGNFTHVILKDQVSITANDLRASFLESLCASVNAADLLPHISDEAWKKELKSRASRPIITKIEQAIAVSESVNDKGPELSLRAGQKLMSETKSLLQQLKSLLSVNDLEYSLIADKLGLEILNRAIEYYNHTDDEDDVYKAFPLQEYAEKIVVGQVAKDRCKRNTDVLRKELAKRPPREVLEEEQQIKKAVSDILSLDTSCASALRLVKEVSPIIQRIEDKLGKENEFLSKISTEFAAGALRCIISDINKQQDEWAKSPVTLKEVTLIKLNSAIKEAKEACEIIDKLRLEIEFRIAKFEPNFQTIRELSNKISSITPNLFEPFSPTSALTYLDLERPKPPSPLTELKERLKALGIVVLIIFGLLFFFGLIASFFD